MRWPFRRKVSARQYQRAVTEIGKGLFGTAVVLSQRLKQGWAPLSGAPDLNNDQWMRIVAQIIWYQLSKCEEAILELELDVRITDDIAERSFARFMAEMDFTHCGSEQAQEQARCTQLNQLRQWQGEAAADYRRPMKAVTPEQRREILRTGSLIPDDPLDRLARRIESEVGMRLRHSDTQRQKDVFKRVSSEGISLEDVYVSTVAGIQPFTDMFEELGFIETFRCR